MLQWFIDTLQRLIDAGVRMLAALISGLVQAPGVAAARATAHIEIRRGAPHEVVSVRHQVLRSGRPRATAVFDGDEAPGAVHWVAVQADRVVGVVSVMPRPMPEPPPELQDPPGHQLRGMAVLPELQGTGVGLRLLEATHELGVALWCNARVAVVPFYARHGWHSAGEPFMIDEVGAHRRMWWRAGDA